MFTGIVEELGRVASLDGPRLRIEAETVLADVELGASIAVNGCCLTVVAVDAGRLSFDAIPQTLAVTSLGTLEVGSGVNLEHAATPMTFLGGHVVLGHVDGLAEVVEVRTDGEWRVRLRLPGELGASAVDKGSITLDGVSLTIARVEDGAASGGGAATGPVSPGTVIPGTIIDVCLIPETLARTNLAGRKPGDRLNVEVDYLAKLVRRQLEWIQARR